jgi:hypothetical protein
MVAPHELIITKQRRKDCLEKGMKPIKTSHRKQAKERKQRCNNQGEEELLLGTDLTFLY